MREGLRRLAILLRWLGYLWAGGWIAAGLIVLLSGGRFSGNDELIIVAFAVLIPAGAAIALAWLIDGFAQKPTS